jgi:hypothetical protein
MIKSFYTFMIATTIFSYSQAKENTISKNSPKTEPISELIKDNKELPTPELKTNYNQEAAISHSTFNTLLIKHVTKNGVVNYKGFKNDHSKLKTYINTLKNNSPKPSWSRNESLTYWINLYNALTIDLLLDNYPIQSITKIDKAWDTKILTIDSQDYTLNDIENKVIRPTFNEPRIHFAVNCGAKSCPKLLNEAFVAEKLESQLEKQTTSFINNSSQNVITASNAQISKIFEWYASDFGNIVYFLNKYSMTKINTDAKIGYLEYEWALNGN